MYLATSSSKRRFKTKAASGFRKVKADIEAIGNSIREEVKREKLESIKNEFRHDMNGLGTAFNDLFKENIK